MSEHKDFLHRQLVKLGDMMGDGLHLEPDGKWISKEYRQTAKALGLLPKRTTNVDGINKAVANSLSQHKCKCGGELKQTRSGSKRVQCVLCDARYELKFKKVKN